MILSIIIVNWQTKKLLSQCLQSIFRDDPDNNHQLIVIDNNSQDSSQELLSELKLLKNNLEVIFNKKNLGFAKAVNQGLKMVQTEYVLLLNPDTEIKEGTIKKMINLFSEDKKIGILGGRILNLDGSVQPSIRRFPDLVSQIFVLLKCHHFFKNLSPIKKYFALDFDYHQTQEAEQVMGSFFMIRRKLIEKIGFFDEKFFLWFEEVDFCQRAKTAGWKIVYYPEAEIIHQGSASFSQKKSIKNQWQFNKSLLYYFKKHHSGLSYLILLIFTPLSLFLALLTSFFPSLRNFKKL